MFLKKFDTGQGSCNAIKSDGLSLPFVNRPVGTAGENPPGFAQEKNRVDAQRNNLRLGSE